MGTTTETIFSTPEFFFCFLVFFWSFGVCCLTPKANPLIYLSPLLGRSLENSNTPPHFRRGHHHHIPGMNRLGGQDLSLVAHLHVVINGIDQLDGKPLGRIENNLYVVRPILIAGFHPQFSLLLDS